MRAKVWPLVGACLCLILTSCGGDGGGRNGEGPMPMPMPTYSIGVTVSGLTGSGLQLKNGSDTLTVAANGPTTLATGLPGGTAYAVTVFTQPTIPAQACTVTNGTGTVASGNVTDIMVNCVTSTAARFAYSVNFDGQSISVYTVDAASGQLRIRGYAKTGKGPGTAAYDPAGKFAFVFNSGFAPSDGPAVPIPPASISVFAHDNVNGDLREVAGSPFTVADLPIEANSMTLHPSGKFVYVTNDVNGGSIRQFSVGPSGTLTENPGGTVAAGAQPTRVVFDPIGRFAYVTNGRSNDLYVYEINTETGALEERIALRSNIGGRSSALTFDPSGKFAYVVNLEPASLSAFAVNASTGALTPIDAPPLPVNTQPHPLLFHPSGKFAYAHVYSFDGTPASIAAFAINAQTGVLTPLAGSPYPAGTSPMALTLAPSGKFLYVTNRGSNSATGEVPAGSICAYSIDAATGVLTAVDGGVMPQIAPFITTIDPSGNYLYSTSVRTDRFYAYRINESSGILTPLSQGAVTRTGHQPLSIDLFVSPTVATAPVFAPKSAYVSDVSSNSVLSLAVNADTGLLTPSGSAPSGGTSVRALAASPTGRYLYSAQLSGNATAYAINSTSGTLTPIDAGTVPAGAKPVAIATDPSSRFVYVANSDDSTVTQYRIDATTGRLTQNGNAVPTVTGPLSMVVDPTGRTLYVMSFSRIQAFSINVESGALGPPAAGEDGVKVLQTGTATQVVVEPGGKYLYLVSPSQLWIEIYPIDAQTGALGAVRVQPTDTQAVSLSIEPTGRFLYTANWNARSISIFAVDQRNGALTAHGSLDVARDPMSVAADFSGRFLHAALADNTGASIATLAIDQATGTLTAIPGNSHPVTAVGLPSIVTVGDVQ